MDGPPLDGKLGVGFHQLADQQDCYLEWAVWAVLPASCVIFQLNENNGAHLNYKPLLAI